MDSTSWINKIYEKTKETKITLANVLLDETLLAALPALIVRLGVTRTGCASSFPPPQRTRELKHKQAESLKAVWLIRGAHQPSHRGDSARSCTQLCYAAIPEHKGKRRCHQQVTSLSTRITDAATGLSAPGCWCWGQPCCASPERNWVGKEKTAQHLTLFQAKVVPRQVLLSSPSQMNKNPYDSDYKEILG